MRRSVFTLTERQWVQVLAALRFWQSAMETSRTHPANHPRLDGVFGPYPPLEKDELDELIEGLPEQHYVTVQNIADASGVCRRTAYYAVERAKLAPDLKVGPYRLYRADRVADLTEKLRVEADQRSQLLSGD